NVVCVCNINVIRSINRYTNRRHSRVIAKHPLYRRGVTIQASVAPRNECRNNPSWCNLSDPREAVCNIHVAKGIESYCVGVVKSSARGWTAVPVEYLPNLSVASDTGCNTRCHFNHNMVIGVANIEVTTPKSESRQGSQACAGSSPAVAQKSRPAPCCGCNRGGISHGEHDVVAVAAGVIDGKTVTMCRNGAALGKCASHCARRLFVQDCEGLTQI